MRYMRMLLFVVFLGFLFSFYTGFVVVNVGGTILADGCNFNDDPNTGQVNDAFLTTWSDSTSYVTNEIAQTEPKSYQWEVGASTVYWNYSFSGYMTNWTIYFRSTEKDYTGSGGAELIRFYDLNNTEIIRIGVSVLADETFTVYYYSATTGEQVMETCGRNAWRFFCWEMTANDTVNYFLTHDGTSHNFTDAPYTVVDSPEIKYVKFDNTQSGDDVIFMDDNYVEWNTQSIGGGTDTNNYIYLRCYDKDTGNYMHYYYPEVSSPGEDTISFWVQVDSHSMVYTGETDGGDGDHYNIFSGTFSDGIGVLHLYSDGDLFLRGYMNGGWKYYTMDYDINLVSGGYYTVYLSDVSDKSGNTTLTSDELVYYQNLYGSEHFIEFYNREITGYYTVGDKLIMVYNLNDTVLTNGTDVFKYYIYKTDSSMYCSMGSITIDGERSGWIFDNAKVSEGYYVCYLYTFNSTYGTVDNLTYISQEVYVGVVVTNSSSQNDFTTFDNYGMVFGFVACLVIGLFSGYITMSGTAFGFGFLGSLMFMSIPGTPFAVFPTVVLFILGLLIIMLFVFMLLRR